MAEPLPRNGVYIVTGAAGGLGRAMTLGLLHAGARVVAGDLGTDRLDALETELATLGHGEQARLIHLDVCSEEATAAAVALALDAFGRLDGIINNAGIGQELVSNDYIFNPPPFWSVPPDIWRRIFDVNAIGPFLLARAAAGPMMAAGGGRIVNITTSLQSMLRRGMAPYAGSKAATEAHSLVMAQDLAGTGVTVNVLVPGGATDTRMVPQEIGLARSELLRPTIMVAPLLWLLSPDAAEVTGRRFVAARWDTSLDTAEAARIAGAPAAWEIPPDGQAIMPASFGAKP
ncbi:SDR family NAD(P)-dependent oxidoreductase [Sphingobium chlorophenolicum]|uniref:Short-chain dehydrogenase/reductase n=1 Tax=Sphingobium chlorophenolicum TaxID=46429 RepID=A0A081RFD3_SPHCR|nr:SDR family oxidoreductase [Sphingobium chlorophenolicum]KEQ53906.1 Short-chain dehydrogenase/reductase [Sphingobium chlorophenolicum]